jgi:hypothetical protein
MNWDAEGFAQRTQARREVPSGGTLSGKVDCKMFI